MCIGTGSERDDSDLSCPSCHSFSGAVTRVSPSSPSTSTSSSTSSSQQQQQQQQVFEDNNGGTPRLEKSIPSAAAVVAEIPGSEFKGSSLTRPTLSTATIPSPMPPLTCESNRMTFQILRMSGASIEGNQKNVGVADVDSMQKGSTDPAGVCYSDPIYAQSNVNRGVTMMRLTSASSSQVTAATVDSDVRENGTKQPSETVADPVVEEPAPTSPMRNRFRFIKVDRSYSRGRWKCDDYADADSGNGENLDGAQDSISTNNNNSNSDNNNNNTGNDSKNGNQPAISSIAVNTATSAAVDNVSSSNFVSIISSKYKDCGVQCFVPPFSPNNDSHAPVNYRPRRVSAEVASNYGVVPSSTSAVVAVAAQISAVVDSGGRCSSWIPTPSTTKQSCSCDICQRSVIYRNNNNNNINDNIKNNTQQQTEYTARLDPLSASPAVAETVLGCRSSVSSPMISYRCGCCRQINVLDAAEVGEKLRQSSMQQAAENKNPSRAHCLPVMAALMVDARMSLKPEIKDADVAISTPVISKSEQQTPRPQEVTNSKTSQDVGRSAGSRINLESTRFTTVPVPADVVANPTILQVTTEFKAPQQHMPVPAYATPQPQQVPSAQSTSQVVAGKSNEKAESCLGPILSTRTPPAWTSIPFTTTTTTSTPTTTQVKATPIVTPIPTASDTTTAGPIHFDHHAVAKALVTKIDAAMDLVKTHLKNTVNEEVAELQQQITKMNRSFQLMQKEIDMLRRYVPEELLSNLNSFLATQACIIAIMGSTNANNNNNNTNSSNNIITTNNNNNTASGISLTSNNAIITANNSIITANNNNNTLTANNNITTANNNTITTANQICALSSYNSPFTAHQHVPKSAICDTNGVSNESQPSCHPSLSSTLALSAQQAKLLPSCSFSSCMTGQLSRQHNMPILAGSVQSNLNSILTSNNNNSINNNNNNNNNNTSFASNKPLSISPTLPMMLANTSIPTTTTHISTTSTTNTATIVPSSQGHPSSAKQ